MIRSIGHVGLCVPDLEAAVEHATSVMGLREVERWGATAYLTCTDQHHDLVLRTGNSVGVDHLALEARGPEALEELRERLQREGVRVLCEQPQEPGLERALRFIGPGEHIFEVYCRISRDQPATYPTVGVRPRRFGHITVKCEDTGEMESFLARVLGFKLSDRIGRDLVWMRCNPDHHGIAIIRGRNQLHHYAWEVEGWPDLERLGDRLMDLGQTIYYGPGRHGPGNNLFAYYLDASGAVVEYFADLQRIWDDGAYQARDWPNQPTSINRWGPAPPPDFLDMGVDVCTPA